MCTLILPPLDPSTLLTVGLAKSQPHVRLDGARSVRHDQPRRYCEHQVPTNASTHHPEPPKQPSHARIASQTNRLAMYQPEERPKRPKWDLWRATVAKCVKHPFQEHEDPAVGLFQRLASPRGGITPIERAIFSVAFYKIRLAFEKIYCGRSNKHPLTVYLTNINPSVDLGKRTTSHACDTFHNHGERNEELCTQLKRPGIILAWNIPHDG